MSKISSKAIVTLSLALLVLGVANIGRADAIPVIIDDSARAPAFTCTAGYSTGTRSDAVDGEDTWIGAGAAFGQWLFTGLTDGTYDVWAHWSVQSNYSTAVTWSFTPDGGSTTQGTLSEKVAVFQSSANGDLQQVGTPPYDWYRLGGPAATALVTDGTLTVLFDATNGGGVYLGLDAIRVQLVQPAPEPSTLALLAAGLAGLLAYAWRKRR